MAPDGDLGVQDHGGHHIQRVEERLLQDIGKKAGYFEHTGNCSKADTLGDVHEDNNWLLAFNPLRFNSTSME